MLGENIILHRKRLGLSQQALADQLHVVRQTVSKWEKNLSVPDADALIRLAEALDTTVQALLGMPEEAAAPETSDIALSLMRINDQLAIQNRRRRRVWTVVAWVLGGFLALNVLLLVLGWASYVDPGSLQEGHAIETTVDSSVEVNAPD